MRRRDVKVTMAAANPVFRAAVHRLELGAAEEELLAGILAEGVAAPSRGEDSAAQASRLRPARLALAASALAAGLIAFFFLVSGDEHGQPTIRPASAYARELTRNAEASPRLLIGKPDWRVEGLQARFQEGEMQFVRDEGPADQRQADLNWSPASLNPLSFWVRDRGASAELEATAPVLGTTARVFQYLGSEPGNLDVTALWQEGELVVEYRAHVPSIAAFEAQLASLRKVSTEAWLAAMPPTVVKPAEFEAAVRQMLRGVPLPPGFGPADVMTESVPTDRYQLAAGVASSVSCTWFARWAAARRAGDEQQVQAAVGAMSTVDTWPLIRQHSEEGAFDQILGDLAKAMPRGSVYKDRPLEYDVDSALGCGRLLGIEIPGANPAASGEVPGPEP